MSRHIRAWSSGGTATNTQTFSAINRLFSERIDIFSPVQFSKVSITTGIIKISLKVIFFFTIFMDVFSNFVFNF